MSQDLFKTRGKANEGVKLELKTPDGKETEHWLQVRHVWSDAFQEANDLALAEVQEVALASEGDKGKIAAAKREAEVAIWASLVADWSFDQECTPENVAAFLRDAPQIGKAIDKFATDGRRFFGIDSTS